MKGLKKIALVTAVAAAPFAAHAEMQAMDDSAMGTVTGQAGVSIELDTQVDIGSVIYQDEGQLAISGVSLGGRNADAAVTGADGALDNLLIEIDVEADGDAVIHVGSTETDGNGGPVPIDFGVSIDSVSLLSTDGSNTSTLLASGIGIEGDIAQLDIRVDTATDNLLVNTAFNITDMEMTLDFLGVSIEDMSITGADTFGADYETARDGNPDPAPSPYAGPFAAASVTVAAVSGVNSNNGEGLSVTIDEFIADVSIGATNIGGASIGTIAMDNLAVTNTKMVVYGRD